MSTVANVYDQIDPLRQASNSWYKNPNVAYIPVVGVLVSFFAQCSFNAQLKQMSQVIKDRAEIKPEQEASSFNNAKDHALSAIDHKIPEFASRALQLIEVSNRHASVSILHGILLTASIISIMALGILNPCIGIPLVLVFGVTTLWQSSVQAVNRGERTRYFEDLK